MPIADDGVLLWQELLRDDKDSWSLHVSKLDGSLTDKVVVESQRFFSGYDVSGSNIVYGFGLQTNTLDILWYSLKDYSTKPITREGINPVVSGNKVVWTAGNIRTGVHGAGVSTSIMMYDLSTGKVSTPVEASDTRPNAQDLLRGHLLVYREEDNLYIRSLDCPCNP